MIESKFGIPCLSFEKYEILANDFKEPKKAILNLNWNVGTHWVGIKTDSFNNLHYFDPFGVNPPFKKLKRNIIFNNIDFQGLTQQNCGWRVLNWILTNNIT